MELRHLRYYVAVAEELSFRRAAERVRVAQPALSKQIKDLEYDVGAKLLDRNTAGVALTDAGATFLRAARDILERAERAIAEAREAESGNRGTLKVANVSAVSASFMPAALSAFHARYPDVDVTLEELMLPDQIAALDAGKVQVGFSVQLADGAFPDHLEHFKVLESEICVVLGSSHPLARKREIALADLVDERLLCIESGAHDLHRKRINALFATRGLKHGALKRVGSIESLQAMIEGDQGVSFLAPVKAAQRRTEGLAFRPIKGGGEDLRFELFAVWRRRGVSQLALNFVEVLRQVSGRQRGSPTTRAA